MSEQNQELGKWFEEYQRCGCSNVAKLRRELPGYCPKHGNDRVRKPAKLPFPAPVGLA